MLIEETAIIDRKENKSDLKFLPITDKTNVTKKQFAFSIFKDKENDKDFITCIINTTGNEKHKIKIKYKEEIFIDTGNLNSSAFRKRIDKSIETEFGIEFQISKILPKIASIIEKIISDFGGDFSEQDNTKGIETLIPNLDGFSSDEIHPAIEFVNDKVYIGLHIPCDSKDGQKESLCFVTSKKEVFHANDLELSERNIRLSYEPMGHKPRWNLTSIKDFKEGSSNILEPAQLFEKIRNQYKYYIDFNEDKEYDLISLWVMGTYFFPLFEKYPYIQLLAFRGSGKTKVGKITSHMSFNGLLSTNISISAMFRTIQKLKPTLILDEFERLRNKERSMDIGNILNSGFEKGGYVYRTGTKEQNFILERFETYSPKMICSVGGIASDTLQDRVIQIVMLKTLKREISEKEPKETDLIWEEIRNDLYPFIFAYWKNIRDTYNSLENNTKLTNRDWDLWKPILTIAKLINNELFNKIVKIAENKTKDKQEDITESSEGILLNVITEAYKKSGDDLYSVKDIRDRMKEMIGDKADWITSGWIGRTLTKYKFERRLNPSTKTGTHYLITKDKLNDVLKRYLNTSLEPLETIETLDKFKETKDSKENNGITDNSGKCQFCFEYTDKRFEIEAKDEIIGKDTIFLVCKNCFDEENNGDDNE